MLSKSQILVIVRIALITVLTAEMVGLRMDNSVLASPLVDDHTSQGKLDSAPPTIISITPIPGNPNPTGNLVVGFQITFSEPVIRVDVSDFKVTTTGDVSDTAIMQVLNFMDGYEVYWIAVYSGNGNGSIALEIDTTETDIINIESTPLDPNFNDGQAITVIKGNYAIWTVTKSADTSDGVCDADCSLRDALNVAASGDVIDFDLPYPATITLSQGVDVGNDVTIRGPGADLLTINRLNSNERVIEVFGMLLLSGVNISGSGLSNFGYLIIRESTFSNNFAGVNLDYHGGAIYNDRALIIENSVFTENSALWGGGGIYNAGTLQVRSSSFTSNSALSGGGIASSDGTLIVEDSVFSGNNTSGSGGGIELGLFGIGRIIRTTFSHNVAEGSGGAIRSDNGWSHEPLLIEDSTFSGNSANSQGGGISNWGTLLVNRVTFSNNYSYHGGGGIYSDGPLTVLNSTFFGNQGRGISYHIDISDTITLMNATLAQNMGGGISGVGALNYSNTIISNNIGYDCITYGNIILNLNNLVTDGSCANGAVNFKTGDPMLGPLQDNGGSTQTMALLPDSPAIDAGDDANCLATDQRGVARPQGEHCDIGAYEYQSGTISLPSAAVYDGWILESSETSGVGGKQNKNATLLRVGDDAANKQYRSILSFDTSTLPEGAVITSVTLKFKHAGVSGTNPFNTHGKLLADMCEGPFKANPVLQLADFKAGCPSGSYKVKALLYTNTKVDNWYSQSLLPDNFQFINLGGVTQFRLRFAKDDNNDFGSDFLKLFSGNALNEADRPQLVIEYYVP